MKKIISSTIALVFASSLMFSSLSFAGLFGGGKEEEAKTQAQMEEPATQPGTEDFAEKTLDQSPPSVTGEAGPAEQVTLSGTINEENNFIADNGESYNLSENDQSMELRALTGKKVEIRGTVMEENGEKTVEVSDYSILDY